MAQQNDATNEDERTNAIALFRSVTAVDNDNDAHTVLEAFQWDLDRAVTSFLDNPDVISTQLPEPSQSSPPSSSASPAPAPAPQNPEQPPPTQPLVRNQLPQRSIFNRMPRWFLSLFSPFRLVWSFFSNLTAQIINFLSGPAHLIEASPGSTPARQFLSFYESRYGSTHPTFFDGPYLSALSTANTELKFLLVYLHSESHRLTPTFCRTVLSNPDLITLADSSFITWAASITQREGAAAHHGLRAPALPFLAVVAAPTRPSSSDGARGQYGMLLAVRAGSSALNGGAHGATSWLSRVLQRHAPVLDAVRTQREERESARLLRQQQDVEFATSLEMDRQKAREAEEERERELNMRRRMDEMELRRARKKEALGAEPDKAAGVASVMLRLPNGIRVGRRFDKDDALEKVFDWAEVNGVDIEIACLVMAFPRNSFQYPEDAGTSIGDAGMFPSCVLLLEERDK